MDCTVLGCPCRLQLKYFHEPKTSDKLTGQVRFKESSEWSCSLQRWSQRGPCASSTVQSWYQRWHMVKLVYLITKEKLTSFSMQNFVLNLYSALSTVSVTVLGNVRQFFNIFNLGYSVSIMWSGICVPNFELSVNLSPDAWTCPDFCYGCVH